MKITRLKLKIQNSIFTNLRKKGYTFKNQGFIFFLVC
jgi:hypothetical protein